LQVDWGVLICIRVQQRKELDMNKTIAIALATATILGSAAPAFAIERELGNGTTDSSALNALSILKDKGYDAVRIENYGNGKLLAFVVDDTGSQVLRFFDADTLAPVAR